MLELSIIVPVYQVEPYIRPCLESIFKQGLDDKRYEVIIVNDGTKDHSMEVISDIIRQHNNITVINQENQGLSVARNNGMAIAKGEYILMIDSDDLLVEGSVARILEIALEDKADLIKVDFIATNNSDIERLNIPTTTEHVVTKMIRGERIFTECLNPCECYIWQTIYKRSFLEKQHFRFIPHIYYEDIPFTHECYLKAQTCIRAHIPLYIYRKRKYSITNSVDKEKCIDYCKVISELYRLKEIDNHSRQELFQLDRNIFIFFNQLFYNLVYCIPNTRDREQICDFLLKEIPNISIKLNLHTKTNTFWFRHFPHLYTHTRYYYGRIVYRHLRPIISKNLFKLKLMIQKGFST